MLWLALFTFVAAVKEPIDHTRVGLDALKDDPAALTRYLGPADLKPNDEAFLGLLIHFHQDILRTLEATESSVVYPIAWADPETLENEDFMGRVLIVDGKESWLTEVVLAESKEGQSSSSTAAVAGDASTVSSAPVASVAGPVEEAGPGAPYLKRVTRLQRVRDCTIEVALAGTSEAPSKFPDALADAFAVHLRDIRAPKTTAKKGAISRLFGGSSAAEESAPVSWNIFAMPGCRVNDELPRDAVGANIPAIDAALNLQPRGAEIDAATARSEINW